MPMYLILKTSGLMQISLKTLYVAEVLLAITIYSAYSVLMGGMYLILNSYSFLL